MADLALQQLGTFRIASPCPMKWDDMEGEGQIRHCSACDLDVYNFSEMSQAEIAGVLAKHGDGSRLCAGWYRRTDGTAIMRDCPVGVRLMRQKVRRAASRIAAAVGVLVMGSLAFALPGREPGRLRSYQPFAALCEWLAPTAFPPPRQWVGGAMVAMPRPTTPSPLHDNRTEPTSTATDACDPADH